jgi:hypothetical protein
MNKELTDYQIGLKGQLLVNLPITIIILLSVLLLNSLDQNIGISILAGTFLGLFYWRFAAAKWVEWADKNNVDHDRLYNIGKSGLLIWNRNYIKEVVDNNRKPWF